MIVFKDIDGYEGYFQVTTDGKVWSVPRVSVQGKKVGGYFLKYACKKHTQYQRVGLRKDGDYKIFFVHVLVAKAFPEICGEWFDGCEVHHKNFDAGDNRAENLIVLSQTEHKALHSESDNTFANRSRAHKKAWETTKNRCRNNVRVSQYSITGEHIKDYESAQSAAIETGTNYGSLSSCLHGRYKTAGGYIWKRAS